jgi:hypothetical protein
MPAEMKVKITAVENFDNTFQKLNKSIAGVRAPIDNLGKNLSKFLDVSGLKAVEQGFVGIGRAGLGALQSISRIIEPLAMITGAGSIGGMAALAASWGQYGQKLNYASVQTGIAATKLQSLQNAGRLAGVSAESVTAAYQGLSQAYFDAIGGRDPAALGLFQRFGIKYDDGTHHPGSTLAGMDKIADLVAGQKDPQAQRLILERAHIPTDMLPLLAGGSKHMHELESQADKNGLLTPADIDAAKQFAKSVTNASEAVEGLSNAMNTVFGPTIAKWLDAWSDDLNDITHKFEANTETQRLADRVAKLSPEKRAEYERMRAQQADRAAKREADAKAGNYVTAQTGVVLPDVPVTHSEWGTWGDAISKWWNGPAAAVPQTPSATASPLTTVLAPGALAPSAPLTDSFGAMIDRMLGSGTSTKKAFSAIESGQGLPSGLLDSVWSAESGRGRHMLSSAGAKGHFQFMDETARQYGLADPNDLRKSAVAAGSYLHDLIAHYSGNVRKAVAGYNWGQGNLDKDIAKFGDAWASHLPRETTGYLARVTAGMGLDGAGAPVGLASAGQTPSKVAVKVDIVAPPGVVKGVKSRSSGPALDGAPEVGRALAWV